MLCCGNAGLHVLYISFMRTKTKVNDESFYISYLTLCIMHGYSFTCCELGFDISYMITIQAWESYRYNVSANQIRAVHDALKTITKLPLKEWRHEDENLLLVK